MEVVTRVVASRGLALSTPWLHRLADYSDSILGILQSLWNSSRQRESRWTGNKNHTTLQRHLHTSLHLLWTLKEVAPLTSSTEWQPSGCLGPCSYKKRKYPHSVGWKDSQKKSSANPRRHLPTCGPPCLLTIECILAWPGTWKTVTSSLLWTVTLEIGSHSDFSKCCGYHCTQAGMETMWMSSL